MYATWIFLLHNYYISVKIIGNGRRHTVIKVSHILQTGLESHMEELPAKKEEYWNDICGCDVLIHHDFVLLAQFWCIHKERFNI